MTSEGPTIADLTVMVQQLRLENWYLENQLAKRKIEVEELRDDLRLLRRGLSAKMKWLQVTRTSIRSHFLRKVIIIGLVRALVLIESFRFRSI